MNSTRDTAATRGWLSTNAVISYPFVDDAIALVPSGTIIPWTGVSSNTRAVGFPKELIVDASFTLSEPFSRTLRPHSEYEKVDFTSTPYNEHKWLEKTPYRPRGVPRTQILPPYLYVNIARWSVEDGLEIIVGTWRTYKDQQAAPQYAINVLNFRISDGTVVDDSLHVTVPSRPHGGACGILVINKESLDAWTYGQFVQPFEETGLEYYLQNYPYLELHYGDNLKFEAATIITSTADVHRIDVDQWVEGTDIRELKDISSDVKLIEGHNLEFTDLGVAEDGTREIEISAEPGIGAGRLPVKEYYRIMGKLMPIASRTPVPQLAGHVIIGGDGCIVATPHFTSPGAKNGTLYLSSRCRPCCDCDDFIGILERLQSLSSRTVDARDALLVSHAEYERGVDMFNNLEETVKITFTPAHVYGDSAERHPREVNNDKNIPTKLRYIAISAILFNRTKFNVTVTRTSFSFVPGTPGDIPNPKVEVSTIRHDGSDGYSLAEKTIPIGACNESLAPGEQTTLTFRDTVYYGGVGTLTGNAGVVFDVHSVITETVSRSQPFTAQLVHNRTR